jgi:hypothetical protein
MAAPQGPRRSCKVTYRGKEDGHVSEDRAWPHSPGPYARAHSVFIRQPPLNIPWRNVGLVAEAVLETAVRMGAGLVLIQEPRGEREKNGTFSYPSFSFIRGGRNIG